jgi:hypothetical protein
MEQKDKELLLKYLCMALSYDLQVKVEGDNEPYTLLSVHPNKGIALIGTDMSGVYATSKVKIDTVKPYLRPMSSMTKEERKEHNLHRLSKWSTYAEYCANVIDWLHVHHFDFLGLIPKGLAIVITEENNPYKIAEK